MEFTNINSKDIIFALDIGTRSIIGTVGIAKDKKFYVIHESYIEHKERAMMDGQIHDINIVAEEVKYIKSDLENKLGFTLTDVAIAAAGRFLKTTTARGNIKLSYEREIDKDIIRSLELTAVKNAENEINKLTEGKLYCVGYSVKNYYLNDYVITNLLSHKGENISVEVIATFLPRSVIESLYSVMEKASLNVINLTLEPIAAIEAAIPQSIRLLNLALVDIGAGTSDIAISSKNTISAYGMVSTAGDEITEIIAQNILVDFNTAEKIKKECYTKDTITYKDVLGLNNEIKSNEVINIIKPAVRKMCEEIGQKIIELNGGKAPNAVFLVGGGAHTPTLIETLAEILNLPPQRIAIKGREAVTQCVCKDNSLGSIGVTVLGIALTAMMKAGNNFIDVLLNGNTISLFNTHKNNVSDALIQAGINPKVLIGKNGKNVRFNLNGVSRIAFGTLGTNAVIKVNGKICSIDTEIQEGDNIEIIFAKNGIDASPKVLDFINSYNTISFYMNDKLTYIEPLIYINGKKVNFDARINDKDEVKIIFPKTIKEYKDEIENEKECIYYLNGKEIEESYVIKEGDRIYKKIITFENEIKNEFEHDYEKKLEYAKKDINNDYYNNENVTNNTIYVLVNGEKTYLKGKEKYIFIDIFDFIDFDLTVPKGNLVLLLNGKKAGYYDTLSQGDEINIYWE
ncbi:cell division protein FtsA [Clostridium sp. USBA 49]|jgi:cell division protein FtsA|uniref:cell division protein FtsA n=1 Tax=Clostridium TaxID=1485 RepID=UPI0009991A49|nr:MULTISPECIES: cell division FtsA domain-containing protein [Clostridium]SKA72875.1 cell division protein FtsA [Clostridium sp. USBA 49]